MPSDGRLSDRMAGLFVEIRMTRRRFSSSVSALRSGVAAAIAAGAVVAFSAVPAGQGQQATQGRTDAAPPQTPRDCVQTTIDRQLAAQVETDKTWQAASEGVMQMQKTTYKSRV